MSRRVVILQREGDRMAAVAAILSERGHPVTVVGSTDEAAALVRDRCGVLLIDALEPDCNGTLYSYVRHEVRPMPAMVGVLAPEPDDEDEGGDPGSVADPDTAEHGDSGQGTGDGMAVPGALPGREATPHPCHGCMVVLTADTGAEEIAAAVEAAGRWWPGDD